MELSSGTQLLQDPTGQNLSKIEAADMKERGGYSGPQLFYRTVSIVKKYRRIRLSFA